MNFGETPLPGACVIDLERHADERGWFARTFDADAFAARGLDAEIVQCSVSFNARRGTLRGMHYQAAPHEEGKLVRCSRGGIYDVIVDLRPDSPAYCRWFGVELTEEGERMLYVPRGVAHGFQTLADDTEVVYQMSVRHSPEHARGVRWDDPAFGIAWPARPEVMSERDAGYPDFAA